LAGDLSDSIFFIYTNFFFQFFLRYLTKLAQKLKVIKSWLVAVLNALKFIHKNGFIFKDLNCGRIYFNGGNGAVAIGDLFVASEIFYQSFGEKVYGKLMKF
jgi:serine/threonine protein kinase